MDRKCFYVLVRVHFCGSWNGSTSRKTEDFGTLLHWIKVTFKDHFEWIKVMFTHVSAFFSEKFFSGSKWSWQPVTWLAYSKNQSGSNHSLLVVVSPYYDRTTVHRRFCLWPIFPSNVTLIQESFDVKPLFMASMGF